MLLALLRTILFLFINSTNGMCITNEENIQLYIIKNKFTLISYFSNDTKKLYMTSIFNYYTIKMIYKIFYKAYKNNVDIQYS